MGYLKSERIGGVDYSFERQLNGSILVMPETPNGTKVFYDYSKKDIVAKIRMQNRR
jgi:hypothetical protein